MTRFGVSTTLASRILLFNQVEWFRDGTPVALQSRLDTHVTSEKHALLLRHLQDSDFGNYMCRASNHLGLSQGFVQLSAIPNTPVGNYNFFLA